MATSNNNSKSSPVPRLVCNPTQLDILCGKTKQCMEHPGTQRFRMVIQSFRPTYAKALTKFDKMCVTKQIVDFLNQSSSRFLKYNNKRQAWEELSHLQARDKVGHALRFANRVTRKPSEELPCPSPTAAAAAPHVPVNNQQPLSPANTSTASSPRLALVPAVLPMIKTTAVGGLTLNDATQAAFTKLHSQQVLPSLPPPTASTPALLVAATLPALYPAAVAAAPSSNSDKTGPQIAKSITTTSTSQQADYQATVTTMASTMRLAGETVALLNSARSSSSATSALDCLAAFPASSLVPATDALPATNDAALDEDFLSFPTLADDHEVLDALDFLCEAVAPIVG